MGNQLIEDRKGQHGIVIRRVLAFSSRIPAARRRLSVLLQRSDSLHDDTEFRIADTFNDSLARLTGGEQKVVETTTFDLQLNPANPGMRSESSHLAGIVAYN